MTKRQKRELRERQQAHKDFVKRMWTLGNWIREHGDTDLKLSFTEASQGRLTEDQILAEAVAQGYQP